MAPLFFRPKSSKTLIYEEVIVPSHNTLTIKAMEEKKKKGFFSELLDTVADGAKLGIKGFCAANVFVALCVITRALTVKTKES